MKTASLVVAGLLAYSALFAAPLPQERPKDVTMPKVVRDVKPNYPDSMKKERVQGKVMLEAVVTKDGNVGEVTVKEPLHPELDAEAVKAMKQWEFLPGTREGKPVDVAVEVEMTFTLK
jgi:TonB family protein